MSTKITLKLFLAGIAAALCMGSASAQSSTTPTIGYYKHVFEQAGAYAVVPGLVTKTDFQGQATSTSVTGTTLTINQSGAAWNANQFNTFGVGSSSHYVEILSDGNASHEGMILDITVNAAGSVSAIVPAGFVAGPSGFSYAIRKHATLGTLLGAGSGVSLNEDLVTFFDSAGNEVVAVSTADGVWANANLATQDLTNTVLYPGQGFLYTAADVRTVTIGGGEVSYVKNGPTRMSLTSGVPSIVGLPSPLVSSGPTDPIDATTGRTSLLSAYGGITSNELAISFTGDGALDTFHNFTKGSGTILDADDSSDISAVTYPNGRAVIIIPGDDLSLRFPQGF
jgi:hypothetical protein